MTEEMPTDVKESLLNSVAQPKPAKQGPENGQDCCLFCF